METTPPARGKGKGVQNERAHKNARSSGDVVRVGKYQRRKPCRGRDDSIMSDMMGLEWSSAGPFGGAHAQEEKWLGMELILKMIYRQACQTALKADELYDAITDADDRPKP